MLENESKPFTAEALKEEVVEAIHNPTKRMQKAFRKLPSSHEWILVSLLDCDGFPSIRDLRNRYRQHRADISEQAFSSALDDLVGTFVKFSAFWNREYVDWIHPSYRDLVIDELMSDYDKQAAFLRNASSIGLGLALSEAGGVAGKRMLPFLGNDKSWQALDTRALDLVNTGTEADIERILRLLSNSSSSDVIGHKAQNKTRRILYKILFAVNSSYEDCDGDIGLDLLRIYLAARKKFKREIPILNLEFLWGNATDRLRETLEGQDFVVSHYAVDHWSKLARIIETNVPSFFTNSTRLNEYREDRERLTEAIETELNTMAPPDEQFDLVETASRLRSLAGAFAELNYDNVIGSEDLTSLASRLEDRADTYERHTGDDDDDDDYDRETDEPLKSHTFDIGAFFSDL